MTSPANISKDGAGFNTRMFRSQRAVRGAFRFLGYNVDNRRHKVPPVSVVRFQEDYNHCSKRFGTWGSVPVTGELGKDTINAVERAVRWAGSKSSSPGATPAAMWKSLCGGSAPRRYGKIVGGTREAVGLPTSDKSSGFVELCPDGTANLRNLKNSKVLRCRVISFEKHGSTMFATVEVPCQSGSPSGVDCEVTSPCVLQSES